MSADGTTPAAGWYPDPHGEATLRWWDGTTWTAHVHAQQAEVATKPSRADKKAAKVANKQEQDRVKQEAIQAGQAEIARRRADGQWWAGMRKQLIGSAIYRGRNGRGKATGLVYLREEGLRWTGGLTKITIPWSSIEAIDIDGETSSRVTVTRAVTIGVFALGAKKKREDCHLSVLTPTMEHAFIFEKTPAVKIRNAMRSVTNALQAQTRAATSEPVESAVSAEADRLMTALATETSPVVAPSSVADELAKLAALHDSGVLSDEEFAAAKARLLA